MKRELIKGLPLEIRKRLKVEWLYASQMYDPENRGVRIVDARAKMGDCQVQSEYGLWFTPNEIWRTVK